MTNPNETSCCNSDSTCTPEVATTETQTTPSVSTQARTIPPRQAVQRTKDGLELWLELPGVEAAAIQLEVADQVLSLKAEPSPTSELAEATSTFCEFGVHPFGDRWTLPADIDTDGIQTRHENGILTITLPKQAPRSRTIQVAEE
tara:strand:- start:3667 stop:4101 length:435 start_codon:yes stop_codon:yes gene_type:complete